MIGSSGYFKSQHVTIDMRPLAHLKKILDRPRPPTGSPLDQMYRQWGSYYLAAIRKRFTKASRTPGHPWKDLAESTKKGRRKSAAEQRRTKRVKTRTGRLRRKTRRRTPTAQRTFAILKNIGILFNALSIGSPGNLFRVVDFGIHVGFSAQGKHPDGKATIAEIATYHQEGGRGKSKLPQRKILVEPRTSVKRQMSKALDKAIIRIVRGQ